MKHKHEDGFTHVLVIVIVLVVIGAIGLFVFDISRPKGQKLFGDGNSNGSDSSAKVAGAYPDTDQPPVLKLIWGDGTQIGIPADDVTDVGQFGGWEGGGSNTAFKENKEPATEIEIRLAYKDFKLYAYTNGIITYAKDETIGIRHGQNFALVYKHVKKIDDKLKTGDKIEAGTFIGTISPDKGKGAFWEIEMNRKDASGVWAVNPVTFFDAEGQASLNALLSKRKLDSWITDANDKDAGWIAHTGKPEICGDTDKTGWKGSEVSECYQKLGLGWILN